MAASAEGRGFSADVGLEEMPNCAELIGRRVAAGAAAAIRGDTDLPAWVSVAG